MDWHFSIKKNEIVFYRSTNIYFNLIKFRLIFDNFIRNIKLMNSKPVGINWNINILSFYQFICLGIIKRIEKSENKEKIYRNFDSNIFCFLENYLENSILKIILFTIIYENLYTIKELFSTIKGIYIEFSEIDSNNLDKEEIEFSNKFLKGFEKIIRFTKTNYCLQRYILVITINFSFINENFDSIILDEFEILKKNPLFHANIVIYY